MPVYGGGPVQFAITGTYLSVLHTQSMWIPEPDILTTISKGVRETHSFNCNYKTSGYIHPLKPIGSEAGCKRVPPCFKTLWTPISLNKQKLMLTPSIIAIYKFSWTYGGSILHIYARGLLRGWYKSILDGNGRRACVTHHP